METPNVRVGLAVLIFRDGKFLMLKRRGSHGAGTWAPPGGHVEFGESFEDTARREAEEETGLRLQNVQFGTVTNDPLPEENKHYVTIWMIGNASTGEARIMEPEKCDALEWCTVDTLPSPLFYNWKTMMQTDFFKLIEQKSSSASV